MIEAARKAAATAADTAGWFLRSLAVRMAILVLVFATVPVMIYQQLRTADDEKQALLLESAQRQGQLIASALNERLKTAPTGIPPNLSDDLRRLADDNTRIKLLLRPSRATGVSGFFYVASAPQIPRALLDRDRRELIERGVLARVNQTCEGDVPLALRLGPRDAGPEVLTSITPINTAFGCWVVVTSQTKEAFLIAAMGQPYYNTREIRMAAVIYFGLAALALAFFIDTWRNLYRFGHLARQIEMRQNDAGSFADQNKVPELHHVAEEFDRLVDRLRQSAENIRRTAEDTAHAFKTPIGVIRQSVEPLKRLVGADKRGSMSIDMIEQSISRLDTLVTGARQMNWTTADLVSPTLHTLDLSKLLGRMAAANRTILAARAIKLRSEIVPGIRVRGSEDAIETIVENVLDNATSFSPPGFEIEVTLKRLGSFAELTIRDQGPGVEPGKVEQIFERYFSERPSFANTVNGGPGETHFGVGLWIVRENVLALGGKVAAENHPDRGLVVRIRLPVVR